MWFIGSQKRILFFFFLSENLFFLFSLGHWIKHETQNKMCGHNIGGSIWAVVWWWLNCQNWAIYSSLPSLSLYLSFKSTAKTQLSNMYFFLYILRIHCIEVGNKLNLCPYVKKNKQISKHTTQHNTTKMYNFIIEERKRVRNFTPTSMCEGKINGRFKRRNIIWVHLQATVWQIFLIIISNVSLSVFLGDILVILTVHSCNNNII